MIWKPVARVKVTDGAVINLTQPSKPTRDKFKLYTIALGPRRQLRCDCGHTWTLLPNELEIAAADAATCSHIKALYGNGYMLNPLGDLLRAVAPRIPAGIVYLTPLGESLFHWRWAANALK